MRVSIVGATGLVGEKILRVLEERKFPITELSLFASEKSAGGKMMFNEREIPIQKINESWYKEKDIVFFAVEASLSRKLLKNYKGNAWVIDNSSAWRLEKDIPLVVPEVNEDAWDLCKNKIIANPNCSTIQLVVTLKPLCSKWKIKKVIVTTMQSVSGMGKEAVEELKYENEFIVLEKKPEKISIFEKQIAANLLPKIGVFDENGDSEEERKIMKETKKILGREDFEIIATCVRVPVFIGHSESIYIQFEENIELKEVKKLFKNTPGIVFLEYPDFPTPIEVAEKDEVFVGRLRKTKNGITYWCVADNLRKGAATNAVQIAELIIQKCKNIDKK